MQLIQSGEEWARKCSEIAAYVSFLNGFPRVLIKPNITFKDLQFVVDISTESAGPQMTAIIHRK
jgi:hypothetical protein